MRVVMLGLSMLVLTGCGVVSNNVKSEETVDTRSLQTQASEAKTPLEVYSWINQNIRYQPDLNSEDEYRSAEETLALGYGDCDDMAVLADDMLKKRGYNSKVISIYTSTEGHTVCVWQDSTGKYNHLSNKTYREIKAQDLKTVAADIYNNWQVLVHYPDNTYEVRS